MTTTNTYDKDDMIRRNRVMIAGPLKLAEYQVRDTETGEFGEPQIHMTFNNMVLGVMGLSAAKLFATFVNEVPSASDELQVVQTPEQKRIEELLKANNTYQEEARDARRRLNEANITIALLQKDSPVKLGA